jgi:hypothetical protein
MIKPGTLCMIRGVPQSLPGHEVNGSVVIANGVKSTNHDGTLIYWIEPALLGKNGIRFTGSREEWLYPFTDPDTLLTSALDKVLETV